VHQRISGGSAWESQIGYCRAVVAGDTVYISSTAGRGPDIYIQTRSALRKIETVLEENGFSLSDVVQTRLVVADFDHWEQAARAHSELMGNTRPAFSLVHALPFVDESILVEVEAVAVRVAK
jgi:enamine deaminase RidA (YjgF/YER057c/UK114 family)